jgi:hypothetical protein
VFILDSSAHGAPSHGCEFVCSEEADRSDLWRQIEGNRQGSEARKMQQCVHMLLDEFLMFLILFCASLPRTFLGKRKKDEKKRSREDFTLGFRLFFIQLQINHHIREDVFGSRFIDS